MAGKVDDKSTSWLGCQRARTIHIASLLFLHGAFRLALSVTGETHTEPMSVMTQPLNTLPVEARAFHAVDDSN